MSDPFKSYALFLLVFCGCSMLYGQNQKSASDSLSTEAINEFIEDHKTQLNVKFEVSNDINAFSVLDGGSELILKPNLNLRYGLVLSYKFLSIRFGLRPRISTEDIMNKGESDTYRFKIKLLFDNWSHLVEYNYDRGYYIDNSGKFYPVAGLEKVQLPYLTSNVIFGSSSYKFNPNYSIRSTESQTEIQTKSAGSLLLGITYNFYKLVGADRILYPDQDVMFRYPNNEYHGINLAATAGYYYTFVLKRNWFANAFGVPGAGIDFFQTTTNNEFDSFTSHSNRFYLALHYGFGAGYNGSKFFFGAKLENRWSNQRSNADKIEIQPQKNTFNFYLGYRFKAPKPVRKPVDRIEEKVPILQDKSIRSSGS